MKIKKVSKITKGRHNAFPTYKVFNGYEYLAFRTSFCHYPSVNSKIIILFKKKGRKDWKKHSEFKLKNTDVRDPQLGIIDNKLCLIFGIISFQGTDIFFTRLENSKFIPLLKLNLHGHMPSEFANIQGKNILLTYKKGFFKENSPYIVNVTNEGNINSITEIENINGTETDLFDFKGRIFGITRIEKSKRNLTGSKIYNLNSKYKLIKERISDIKFDSPEFFELNNQLYFFSRITTVNKGKYNVVKIPILPWFINSSLNIFLYWITPKSFALFSVDEDLNPIKIFNIGTTGDTGYSSYSNGKVFTYGSVHKEKQFSWAVGQFLPSEIYEYSVTK